jgi:hypothetical protein
MERRADLVRACNEALSRPLTPESRAFVERLLWRLLRDRQQRATERRTR